LLVQRVSAPKLTKAAFAMLKLPPSLATSLSPEGGWLPSTTPAACGVSTSQALARPGAGLAPKNPLLQATVPDAVFCTHLLPAPYRTAVAAGSVKLWPWSAALAQLASTFMILATEGTPALSMTNSM
jgi:hypothetical protein